MEVTVLVTNGGPHPPDKWAALTAKQIAALIQIDEQSDTAAAATARKAKPRLEIAISDAIESSFTQIMSDELALVNTGAITARNDPFQADQYIDAALSGAVATTVGTPFEVHFSDAAVQAIVRSIISQNILDAANVQRSWAFDDKGL